MLLLEVIHIYIVHYISSRGLLIAFYKKLNPQEKLLKQFEEELLFHQIELFSITLIGFLSS